MPNAVDNFSSFYSQYVNQTVAPAAAPAGNYPAPGTNVYDPYASSYVPDPNRYPQYGTPTAPSYPAPPQNPYQVPVQPTYPTSYPTSYPTTYPTTYPTSPYGQYPGYPSVGQGPVSAVAGSLRGVIKGKGYDDFATKTAPMIDVAIPIVSTIMGLFGGHKNQPAPMASGNGLPNVPSYPQYPTTSYPQYPNYQPTAQGDWTTQVGQGVQGVASLVSAIGGLFRH